jgi:protein-S-isoprenylcysteine O-methyltransferase Ste14
MPAFLRKYPKIYAYFLVTCQFLLIGLLGLNSGLLSSSVFNLFLVLSGIFLGVWALFVMRKSKISVSPEVSKGADLIKTGPYKLIRHPMYSSVLLVCLGFFLSNLSLVRILFYLLLIIVLTLKVRYEEKLLILHFPTYKEYMKTTKRFIPFVF